MCMRCGRACTSISQKLELLLFHLVTEVLTGTEQIAAMQVVIVQSTAYGAPHLERRIEAFWRTWQRELEAMSNKEFAKQVFVHFFVRYGTKQRPSNSQSKLLSVSLKQLGLRRDLSLNREQE